MWKIVRFAICVDCIVPLMLSPYQQKNLFLLLCHGDDDATHNQKIQFY